MLLHKVSKVQSNYILRTRLIMFPILSGNLYLAKSKTKKINKKMKKNIFVHTVLFDERLGHAEQWISLEKI